MSLTERTPPPALEPRRVLAREAERARWSAADLHSSYWTLFWEITRCETKLREQGKLLGFFWTLLHPLLLFVVMHELFSKWMGRLVPDFPYYLMVGLVQWTFFADATSNALRCFLSKGPLVQNFKFPREIVVLSAVSAVLWSHLMELGVLLAFLLVVRGQPAWTWLYLPVLVVIQALWILGVSLFLARWAVDFRDLERIWAVLMQASFFMVPVFYPLKIIDETKRTWLMLNPLVHLMDGMRGCLLRGQVPPAWVVAALLGGGAAAAAFGLWWFRRHEGTLVDAL